MKKFRKALFFVPVVIILLLIIMLFYVISTVEHPFISGKNSVTFEVPNGESLSGLINKLSEKKVMKNSYIIRYYIKSNHLNTVIKPGVYVFKSNTNILHFVMNLNNGTFDEGAIRVTIPEGYDVEQIAELLDKKGVISKNDFIQSVKDYPLPNYIQEVQGRKYQLEGYLFPDTYDIKKKSSGKDIIKIMLNRFKSVMNNISKDEAIDEKGLDENKIVTMASIVEREAKVDSERSVIASVFYNRLNIKMKLQSCATVEYALGVYKTKLLYKDINSVSKSLYNTYFVSGLPVGPICNPGKKSIEAAIKPSSTKYIYFGSKNNGTSYFDVTEADFLKDKGKYQGF